MQEELRVKRTHKYYGFCRPVHIETHISTGGKGSALQSPKSTGVDRDDRDRGVFIILKSSSRRKDRRANKEFASISLVECKWIVKKEPVEHYKVILKNDKWGNRYELSHTLYSREEIDNGINTGRFSSREFVKFDTENPIMLEPL